MKKSVATMRIAFRAEQGSSPYQLVEWINYVDAALRAYAVAGYPPPMYAEHEIVDASLVRGKD